MNLDIKRVKIFTTVPSENLATVRDAMCAAGAGAIGNYDHCVFSCKGVGSFCPNDEANPYIGEKGQMEFVDEEKLEVICDVDKVKTVVAALRKAHPYEEPAIDIVPLLDESLFV